MDLVRALGSGAVGAVALTMLHEAARRLLPQAPRADLLGMRAIAAGLHAADLEPPPADQLHRWALVGDLVTNSFYYSLVGDGRGAWRRGALLGLGAGLGAVALPGPLGLGSEPSARTPATAAMTVAWYLVGGLAAAAAARLLAEREP